MRIEIPEARVAEPSIRGSVAAFPLFTGLSHLPDDHLDYLVASEAMAAGTVEVREVSEEGSVGAVLADNGGDLPVFFLEGEELRGARQNRIVASSALVPGRSRTRIPVCCVQRGKWTYSSRQFGAGCCCPPSLRLVLKQGDRISRQEAVWKEIRRKHQATATRSEKEDLADVVETHRERVEGLRDRLRCPDGASGITVALDGKLVALDLFDKPATVAKLWDRLVQGAALDALELPGDCQADVSGIPVRLYMERIGGMRWQEVATVGIGKAYQARGNDGSLATVLVMDGVPIHLSVSMPS